MPERLCGTVSPEGWREDRGEMVGERIDEN